MEGEITEKNILKFIDDWENNKLKPHLKTAEEPKENNGDVFVVVRFIPIYRITCRIANLQPRCSHVHIRYWGAKLRIVGIVGTSMEEHGADKTTVQRHIGCRSTSQRHTSITRREQHRHVTHLLRLVIHILC